MHIKRIEIKNWLGIKELLFSPGKINKVSGDSGTGKTSLVEGLEKLFTNKNRRTEVIRHDADEAELFVELDDGLQTTRKVRAEKADYLKVKHDSKAVASTEAFLRQLINGEIFRPIEFVQRSAKEQTEIILNMLQIGWTIDDIKTWFGEVPEADYQLHILQILKQIENVYYAERESINREINLLRANIEGIKRDLPANYDGEEWRGVNLQALYKQLSDAEESNKRLAEAQTLVDGLSLRIDDIKQRAANKAEEKRLEYKRQRDNLTAQVTRLEEFIQRDQAVIDDSDRRLVESAAQLDNDLEQAIERLRLQFQAKKQAAREEIQQASEQSRVFISEYREQIAEKRATLGNVDEHERKDLEKITDHETSLIATEKDKTGNAQEVAADTVLIDTVPLKESADNAVAMKEYLREWERMREIIREKLAPKEERSAELTQKIQKARELPKELLKTAALPVAGLSVDDQGRIRINGTLIDGLSEGEALEFAFMLAKEQAGELKVICVDGWQNLGSRQQEIIESAKHDDYQYFVLETVEGEPLKIENMEG
ncbi:AAA family ATPase [Paenibacillus gorillae]|uniref:AAA family ATPase n=1 Tax=Paenibacillus gorillae TaxID=1243662 RepID=UPI000693897B|nr:AAA family ATPase [Paenibacillus gorillae]